MDLIDSNQDYLDITIRKYEKYPRIQMIKQNFSIPKKFSFQPVSKDEAKKIIKDLKNSKSVRGEIPTKIFKECEFTFEILKQRVNKSFASGTVGILPLLSKVYKKLLYNRLCDYLENIFSVIHCDFQKAHSTQQALFKLLQLWQKELDEKGMVATVSMDLSKAYDCIPYDLLIAKLSAYGIDSMRLLLISGYLSRHKKTTKIGSSYSS